MKPHWARATSILIAFLFLGSVWGIEPEPDWTNRFVMLKSNLAQSFQAPKVGEQVAIVRRIGGSYRGRINAITGDAITIDGTLFKARQLTDETCVNLFAEAFARQKARSQVLAERDAYRERLAAEQEQILLAASQAAKTSSMLSQEKSTVTSPVSPRSMPRSSKDAKSTAAFHDSGSWKIILIVIGVCCVLAMAASKTQGSARARTDKFLSDIKSGKTLTPSAGHKVHGEHGVKSFERRMCRSPLDFEVAARDWMLHWGFADARLTGPGPDDGIDVVAKGAVAQVKAWMTPVGIAEVQRLKGAAYDGRDVFFFSLMEYTESALRFANDANVNLFCFVGYDGTIEPVNVGAVAFFRTINSTARNGLCVSPGGQDYIGISNRVTEAFQRATELPGFAIIAVRNSGNRYVQFCGAQPNHLECVGRIDTESTNPITPQQLVRLVEIGWPKTETAGGNFIWPSSGSPHLAHFVEMAARTLVEVHGAGLAGDLAVTVESLY